MTRKFDTLSGCSPPSGACDFLYNTDQAGGCSLCGEAKRWGIPIMKDPANPAGQVRPTQHAPTQFESVGHWPLCCVRRTQAQCDNSTHGVPHGICARSCCAHCLNDKGCVQAALRGDQCWLTRNDPAKPMGKRVPSTGPGGGHAIIVPKR